MEAIIKSLSKRPSGHGHFKISITIDGEVYSCVTTNTLAIDAAFDEDYDTLVSEGAFYESMRQAEMALVNEIARKNDLDI